MKKRITLKDLRQFSAAFDAEPKNALALNAVAKSGIAAVALNRDVVSRADHTYSHLIETPEATNQKSSGRCWLFAGLNALRLDAMKKMNLEKFELSQSYMMFWDKLEKANFFLENIIETRNEPLDGRLVMWLLRDPVPDGGQWDMFVNLIEKYGVVPKTVMPETNSSSKSGPMNAVLVAKLRECAQVIREMNKDGKSLDAMRAAKEKMMEGFYKILCIHLGRPSRKFMWEWRDKDKKFTRHGTITPKRFFKEYVGTDLDDMVCLINAPTQDKPFNTHYTVAYLGNVAGGRIVSYLNVDSATLKRAAIDMIVDGRAVWFGCDVGKMMDHKLGILDVNLYDYELVCGAKLAMDKAGRLDYGQSRMTHAMVLTGVDINNAGKPVRWRVENSWGSKKHGDKGYMLMNDNWFDEYLYEITISRKYVPEAALKALGADPVVLPPWDPMGALAVG